MCWRATQAGACEQSAGACVVVLFQLVGARVCSLVARVRVWAGRGTRCRVLRVCDC